MGAFSSISIHSPVTRPCSPWVPRAIRNGQRGWFQGRKKAYAKEMQGKRAAGSEVRRLTMASERRWFRCEFSRRMGLRISRGAWRRGPCWVQGEQMKRWTVEAPLTDVTQFTTLQWPAHWRQPEPARRLASSIPGLGPA